MTASVPGPARILVVEDDSITLEVTAAVLEHYGYVVSKAYDGLQALAACAAEVPDLVLLNVMMPRMDGFETCRRIRADPTTAHIPVVMVTGQCSDASRAKGFEADADDYFTKPVHNLALVERVRSLLAQKR
jgi:DNA-binding response OmpR family regulator